LAGLIPITPSQKQSLLEAFDSKQRMNLLEKLVNQISENSA
jgi:Lon protease-like protein